MKKREKEERRKKKEVVSVKSSCLLTIPRYAQPSLVGLKTARLHDHDPHRHTTHLTMSRTLHTLARRSPIHTALLRASPRFFTTSTAALSRLRQPGEPTGPNEPPSHITTPKSKSPLKVWPILGIFALGGFLFKKIVDQRAGTYQTNGPGAGHSPSRP